MLLCQTVAEKKCSETLSQTSVEILAKSQNIFNRKDIKFHCDNAISHTTQCILQKIENLSEKPFGTCRILTMQ